MAAWNNWGGSFLNNPQAVRPTLVDLCDKCFGVLPEYADEHYFE